LKPYGENEYEPVNKYVTVDIKQGVLDEHVSIDVSIGVSM
jgi:hypothetical protein